MRRIFTTVSTTIAIAGAVVHPPAAAQERGDTVRLVDIVVTPTRLPTPIAAQTTAVTVIQGEELRARGIRFVADALRDVPGAAVVQTGSYGATTSLFLRGGESDYVKILVDGVPVNQPGGSFDFSSLITDNIDRIEVVRGPSSVVYGSDAVTGVIQIFTRRGTGPPAVEAAVEGGSFGSSRLSGGVSGGSDQLGYSVSLSHLNTNGIYAFNSEYRNTVGSALVRARLDSVTDVTLAVRTLDGATHYPTDFYGDATDSNQVHFEQGLGLSADFGRRLTDRLEARILLTSYSSQTGSRNRPDSPADTVAFGNDGDQTGEVLRRSADLRANYVAGPAATLTAGVVFDADRDREFSQSVSNAGRDTTSSVFDATRSNVGYYLQGSVAPIRPVTMNLGLRLDDNQEFGTFVTYRAGAVWAFGPSTRLRASVGSAFKAPYFSENFARTPFEIGNPHLNPERSRSWEIGVERELAGGKVVLGATWFDQRFRDFIQYSFLSTPSYSNIGRATAKGLETSFRLTSVQGMDLQAQYTLLETRITDAGASAGPGDVFATGKPLIRRPKHTARLSASRQLFGVATLGVGVRYVGSRKDVNFKPYPSERVTLASYTTTDLNAEVHLLSRNHGRPATTLTVRLENAFDEHYVPVFGYRAPGRAVFVGGRFGL